jgi:UDP-glucuronate 4-epimerase
MKILVTGGAGFIGSHLVDAFVGEGHHVSVIDDFNDFYSPVTKHRNLEKVISSIRLHVADIRDRELIARIVQTEQPETIVHLAARAGVRPSVQQPELYLQTNIIGTFNLLEAAKASHVTRFIFASSSSVYGACKQAPFREDQVLTQTLSPYAGTKLAGEHLCSNYSYLYGLKVVCLRFFTVYGPRQRPDLAIHKFAGLIHQGKQIEVYGDGSAQRDFTYVDDIIQGILAATRYEGTDFDVFNLGESDTTRLSDVISALENALRKKAEISYLPPVPGDMSLTHADISKARALLGYVPTTRIAQGIPKFIDWFLTSQEN